MLQVIMLVQSLNSLVLEGVCEDSTAFALGWEWRKELRCYKNSLPESEESPSSEKQTVQQKPSLNALSIRTPSNSQHQATGTAEGFFQGTFFVLRFIGFSVKCNVCFLLNEVAVKSPPRRSADFSYL